MVNASDLTTVRFLRDWGRYRYGAVVALGPQAARAALGLGYAVPVAEGGTTPVQASDEPTAPTAAPVAPDALDAPPRPRRGRPPKPNRLE